MLGGEGFAPMVEQGATVRAGQPLIEFNADYVAQHAPSLVSVIAVANGAMPSTSSSVPAAAC